jgi:hypothetical protein
MKKILILFVFINLLFFILLYNNYQSIYQNKVKDLKQQVDMTIMIYDDHIQSMYDTNAECISFIQKLDNKLSEINRQYLFSVINKTNFEYDFHQIVFTIDYANDSTYHVCMRVRTPFDKPNFIKG